MAKGLVVVIAADDWIARLLTQGLTEHGYQVARSPEGLAGFNLVRERKPDCIICDVALPDFDGHWVAHSVRAERSEVATTPFMFLANADDDTGPRGAFNVGAEVLVTKPFRVAEVVQQIDGLVELANGLRKRRDLFIEGGKAIDASKSIDATKDKKSGKAAEPIPPASDEVFGGDLAQMSLATVVTLLEMDRRSGRLEITTTDTTATIDLLEGLGVGGGLGGRPTALLDVLGEVAKWKAGRFSFVRGKNGVAPDDAKSVAAMMFHAVCIDDAKAAPPAMRGKIAIPLDAKPSAVATQASTAASATNPSALAAAASSATAGVAKSSTAAGATNLSAVATKPSPSAAATPSPVAAAKLSPDAAAKPSSGSPAAMDRHQLAQAPTASAPKPSSSTTADARVLAPKRQVALPKSPLKSAQPFEQRKAASPTAPPKKLP